MIKKNRGNLLEQHAEKIVLAVVGIISVVLLWMFVLTSPNAVKIEGGSGSQGICSARGEQLCCNAGQYTGEDS